LKVEPQELTYEDFKKKWKLESKGINAHRLTKKDVTDENCGALFWQAVWEEWMYRIQVAVLQET
jgi:hypothetical protein